MTLRYSVQRSGVYYFQRPVPKDLAHHFKGRLVRQSLATSDVREAALKVASINRRLEAQWSALRASPGRVLPPNLRKQAISLLEGWGLEASSAGNHEAAIDLFLDHFVSAELSPSEGAVASEAAQLLAGVRKDRLSDVLDDCLAVHPKRGDAKFVADTRRAFNKLIQTVGDKHFDALVRADAHKFIDSLLKGNSSSGTTRRYVNVCHAVINQYLREKDIQRTNPFASVAIPQEGNDTGERQPYTSDELQTLCGACVAMDDDIRWITALIADTGARLAEVVGLALDDIVLAHATPHVIIKRHAWRSLKNRASAREVPLVGYALWAARRVVDTARDGQQYAFPRYTVDGLATKATGASNTIVKWIRKLGLEHNVHELRHTMIDRLRDVDCPEDIQFAIGGWARDGVGAQYGRGHTLRVKSRWLLDVADATAPKS